MEAPLRALRILPTLSLCGLFALPTTAQAGPICFGREATIVGTSGFDSLHGTADVDVISGLAGGDAIASFGGDDFVCGGSGADQSIDAGDGNDLVKGGPGSDELQGGSGDDRLLGGENMFGDDGDDFLRASIDKEFCCSVELDGGLGADTCVGDANDRYSECEVIRIRP